jgi:hypothetical protein
VYRIVYTSVAAQEFSVAAIETLLRGARRRNATLGVTGMLVFHSGTFLQAIEGEKRAANEIFARVQDDPRHRDIVLLHRGLGPEQRAFGAWPMGFADSSGAGGILKGFMRMSTPPQFADLDCTRAIEFLAACGEEDALKIATA